MSKGRYLLFLRRIVWSALCTLSLCAPESHAQNHRQEQSVESTLEGANTDLIEGDLDDAEKGVLLLLHKGSLHRSEKAEVYRILGLVKFYQEDILAARQAFLQYLLLDPNAHLDPVLTTPEAISLLEDVRSGHQGKINSNRFVPIPKRYWSLNLIPAAGQFQNGDHRKAWLIAGGMGFLTLTHLGSYWLLGSYCNPQDHTCYKNGEDKTEVSRNLKGLNILSGVGLISMYVYSTIDGFVGYRRLKRRDRQRVQQHEMVFRVIPGAEELQFRLGIIF